MTKPLFMWAGGKNKMLKHYRPYLPTTVEEYCEPFFGGGAMFIYITHTYAPKRSILNDINPSIMNIYRAIRDYKTDFLHTLDNYEQKYLPLSKEDRKKYFYQIRSEHAWEYDKWSTVQEAATLYFLMKTEENFQY